jgi:hypothetical protein
LNHHYIHHGPEKVLRDFGVEPEEFDEVGLLNEVQELKVLHRNDPGTTEGIFAPWAFWKKDFQEIGGHDKLYMLPNQRKIVISLTGFN